MAVGSKDGIGPIGDHDEPYEYGGSFWQRVYDRQMGYSLSDGMAFTYAKLLALRSRHEAECVAAKAAKEPLDLGAPILPTSQRETALPHPEVGLGHGYGDYDAGVC